MPKTRRTQMLLRVAMQADYLRNTEARRPVETSLRLPPPNVENPDARREISEHR
jgi:hypothetical protein